MRLVLDHVAIHVSDWDRSGAFYSRVLGADIVPGEIGFATRIGDQLLNCRGPGERAEPVVAEPVMPGNSDLGSVWLGPIEDAIAHLDRAGASVDLGPVERTGARATGPSIHFRDPGGSLLEFLSYDR